MTAMNHGGIYLSELLDGFASVEADQDKQIMGIELDSRTVHQGDCFIAINGTESHGVDFIADAFCKGAVAILVDSEDVSLIPEQLMKKNKNNIIFVDQLAVKTGEIAHRYYGQPTDLMKVFGVTGTNGKTSVSNFIGQAIDKISGSGTCGVIGTLGSGLFGEFVSSGMTTPDSIRMHLSLSRLRDQGAQATVIEASSHGLAQHRLSGVDFDVAVFTNLSRDHLDYHGDMQTYGAAKLELFKSPDLQAAVINLDDPFSEKILQVLSDNVQVFGYTLGLDSHPGITVIRCSKLDFSVKGLIMEIDTPQGSNALRANLLGRFNASNLLAAMAALMACGFHFEEVLDALSEMVGVPGRMEAFVKDAQAAVVVDFAHTPDGLTKALETLKEISSGKLWCVFGCGGDRDKGKRPLMGDVVEKLADTIIVTNDNPRSEEPSIIASGILSGMKKPGKAKVIFDRKLAIETAIKSAHPKDIILVAGKGHENWQEIKGQRFPFNDRNVVLNTIGNVIGEGAKND